MGNRLCHLIIPQYNVFNDVLELSLLSQIIVEYKIYTFFTAEILQNILIFNWIYPDFAEFLGHFLEDTWFGIFGKYRLLLRFCKFCRIKPIFWESLHNSDLRFFQMWILWWSVRKRLWQGEWDRWATLHVLDQNLSFFMATPFSVILCLVLVEEN